MPVGHRPSVAGNCAQHRDGWAWCSRFLAAQSQNWIVYPGISERWFAGVEARPEPSSWTTRTPDIHTLVHLRKHAITSDVHTHIRKHTYIHIDIHTDMHTYWHTPPCSEHHRAITSRGEIYWPIQRHLLRFHNLATHRILPLSSCVDTLYPHHARMGGFWHLQRCNGVWRRFHTQQHQVSTMASR